MKNKIFKILLIVLIIVHVAAPFVELAVWGYDWMEMLSDIYKNGVIVVLSAAVLCLYNSKDKDN